VYNQIWEYQQQNVGHLKKKAMEIPERQHAIVENLYKIVRKERNKSSFKPEIRSGFVI